MSTRAEYCLMEVMGALYRVPYISEGKLQRSVSNVIISTRARKCKESYDSGEGEKII